MAAMMLAWRPSHCMRLIICMLLPTGCLSVYPSIEDGVFSAPIALIDLLLDHECAEAGIRILPAPFAARTTRCS